MKTWVQVPRNPHAQGHERQLLILWLRLLYGVPAIAVPIKRKGHAHAAHQRLDARDGGPRESLDSFFQNGATATWLVRTFSWGTSKLMLSN